MHHQAALRQIRRPLRQRQAFQQNTPKQFEGLVDVGLVAHTALQAALEQDHPGFALGDEHGRARGEGGVELLDVGAAVGLGLWRVQFLDVQRSVGQNELAW